MSKGLVVPIIILLFCYADGQKYYLCSVLMIIYGMVQFFLRFEKKKPEARQIVTIAVLCAIAVTSRVAFIMFPGFKPMVGIIMIAGMAFGAETGFLIGAISGFVSNFIFGQGPWTPWQMFAFGIAGFLAGMLAKKGILKSEKKLTTALIGAVLVLGIVGPILDTSTVLSMGRIESTESAIAIYSAGVPVNAIHALATALTLWFLSRSMIEKLERLKMKYGLLSEE